MNLINTQNALINLRETLTKQGNMVGYDYRLNRGRYRGIKVNFNDYLIIFKKDVFRTYGLIFNNKSEVGEAINREDIQTAKIAQMAGVIVLYSNGSMYAAALDDIIKLQQLRFNAGDGKEQYCFPLKMMKNLKEVAL